MGFCSQAIGSFLYLQGGRLFADYDLRLKKEANNEYNKH